MGWEPEKKIIMLENWRGVDQKNVFRKLYLNHLCYVVKEQKLEN